MASGVIGKAISLGFETAIKVNKVFTDENGKKWNVYIASSSEGKGASDLPVYLLTSGRDLKVADDDETFQIMCTPVSA